jgi:hypothetical protein
MDFSKSNFHVVHITSQKPAISDLIWIVSGILMHRSDAEEDVVFSGDEACQTIPHQGFRYLCHFARNFHPC